VGAAFFASYLVLSQRWQIKTMQVLLCGAVINGLFFIPIWALFLPSGMAQAALDILLLQMIYQGLVPNLLGLILIAHAARTIGAEVTSGWLAAVPAVATVLGVGFLNETLSLLSWLGLAVLTVGLCVVAFGSKPPSAMPDFTDISDPPVDK
jgi:drug/metabolite transporter (DMT)-like permease